MSGCDCSYQKIDHLFGASYCGFLGKHHPSQGFVLKDSLDQVEIVVDLEIFPEMAAIASGLYCPPD